MRKNIRNTIAFVIMFALTSLFFACANNSNVFIATNIVVGEIIINGSEDPALSLQLEDSNGAKQNANINDFWFNAQFVYVQDGLVKTKIDSPAVFDDGLSITYRKNDKLTTKVMVHKVYIQLQSLTLTTENGKTSCSAGANIQMMPIFTPSNATDRNVTYEITNDYEYAAISPNGLLSVNGNAASGDEIKIVIINGEIVSPIFTVTVTMPTVTQTIVVFDGAEQVTDKGDTCTEFFAFDEIDLYELRQQGYEDIQFSFKIEALEIKSGYADIYLDLQKKNGDLWCVYKSEGYFVIGAVGWTDYPDDGYGANTWGYFADNTLETNISITKLIQNCGATPSIRLSCGASGKGQNEWMHGYSTVTISVS